MNFPPPISRNSRSKRANFAPTVKTSNDLHSTMVALTANALTEMYGGAAPQRPLVQITEIKSAPNGNAK